MSFGDGLFLGVDPLEPDQRLRNQNPDTRYAHEPVISSFAEVFVGVSVNLAVVQVAVEGGVTAFGGSFIAGTVDNAGDGVGSPTYVPNLPSTGQLQALGDPCFFDIAGTVNAVVRARFTIDFYFLSFSCEATFAEVTIVDLVVGCDAQVDPVNGFASLNGPGDLLLHVGLIAEAGNGIVGTTQYKDAADYYQIANATDENGTVIPGALAVTRRGLTETFSPAPGRVIKADMEFLAGPEVAQSPNSVVLAEDVTTPLDATGGNDADVFVGGAGDDTLAGGAGPTGCSAMTATTCSSAARAMTCWMAARGPTPSTAGRAATRPCSTTATSP